MFSCFLWLYQQYTVCPKYDTAARFESLFPNALTNQMRLVYLINQSSL